MSFHSPPPLDFIPVQTCDWAELVQHQPEFIHRPIRKGRRLLGIKYELAGHVWLQAQFGDKYTPGQWVRFKADGQDRFRWCQPDGLLLDSEHKIVTIIEFKYQHTDGAWWQLFKLYKPVVAKLLGPDYQIRCLEVCKWFDAAIRPTQRVVLCKSIDSVQAGDFGVHIWKP